MKNVFENYFQTDAGPYGFGSSDDGFNQRQPVQNSQSFSQKQPGIMMLHK